MDKDLFDDLVAGMEEMVAFEKGQLKQKVDTRVIKPRFRSNVTALPASKNRSEISALRTELEVSQADFAKILGVSSSTVSSWEQGNRKPSGAAAKLITLLENDPTRINELMEG